MFHVLATLIHGGRAPKPTKQGDKWPPKLNQVGTKMSRGKKPYTAHQAGVATHVLQSMLCNWHYAGK
jgi:hypothetical protein